ncbi:MAG: cysteine--tRNA ligase [Methylococcaceae bacterium]|nr:cysteine--tRNA ligase [Methylococcaceae bacterium]
MKIYNTLTRKKEEFQPREAGKIGIYVCGMTVYDYCHIGHARVMVVFDTVARYFRYKGYKLTYVRNITDIDDKIINRANENGEDFTALTQRFIDAMHEDEQALSVLPPDVEPRATQSIPSIIAMIETLIVKGLAYVGTNGDVFYSVNKFKPYGKLSGKNLADLQAGERVNVDFAKQDPVDFVLWKMAKPGEPYWESPWGNGRPGWHIECSAMSTCCLGNHFDIHGGGMDLQFPHHENEIAQSEGATGETFVNVWMHNGFVRVDNEKMSKSLGNFFTVREVLKQYQPEVIRFFILQSHYRSPLNYSDEQLNDAKAGLTRLYTALRGVEINDAALEDEYKKRFEQAMEDDFNTPVALSILFDLAKELNIAKKEGNQERIKMVAITLKYLGGLLGVLFYGPEDFLKQEITGGGELRLPLPSVSGDGTAVTFIDKQIQARVDAKKSKNWALADQIRDELKQQGVILEDKPDGTTTWRRE